MSPSFFIDRDSLFSVLDDGEAVWLSEQALSKFLSLVVGNVKRRGGIFPNSVVRMKVYYDGNCKNGPLQSALTITLLHEKVNSQRAEEHLPILLHPEKEGRTRLEQHQEALAVVQKLFRGEIPIFDGVPGLTMPPDATPTRMFPDFVEALDLQAEVSVTKITDPTALAYKFLDLELTMACVRQRFLKTEATSPNEQTRGTAVTASRLARSLSDHREVTAAAQRTPPTGTSSLSS